MKKHYGVTALLLAVLLLMLAACGGAPPTQAPAAAPTEAQAEAPTTAPTEAQAEAPTTAPTEAITEEAPEATEAPAEAASGVIKIAILGPFTGDAASIGTEQLNFARLAVEDFNNKMGTTIELVEEDTQLDPAIATTVAQKVVSDPEIFAVIGPAGSQEVEATASLFEEAKLVHISPSATRPSLSQSDNTTFFRVVPNDDVQGPTDATFIMENLQAKSVVIIDDQTSYSVSLADIVEKALQDGGVTTARESVTQEDSDFSALVTKIKAAGADTIFFPGQIATQGAQLWKQMQEQGVEATLMGADGFNSPDLVADGANEGSYVSNFAPDIKGVPEAADVAAAYAAEYGEFGAFGPPAYVATQVALEAIDRAMQAGQVTREAVLAEVGQTDIAKTILGTPMKFDANGDVEGAQFYIFEVKEGKFSLAGGEAEGAEAGTAEATEEAASSDAATGGTIKIAIMGPFTGDAASIGTEQLNFARVAVEDFNQKMGTNIELVEEDTQLDPAIATTVAQKLVADPEILAVIGPSGSQEVEASAELFEGVSLVHVSPSATRPTLTQAGYKTFFRVVPNDDVQGPTDVKFMIERLQAKSVVVIDDQTSYSVSLSDLVEKGLQDGGVTVVRESVTQEDSDFSALVTKIKAAGADVIFFPGQIATQGAQLWKQMQEQGVQATLMGGDGFNSPDLIADGANEGSYVSNFAPDIKGIPEAAAVIETYSAEYGEFGAFGPPTYVAAQVILEAIDRAMKSGAVTRESVLAEVAKTDISKTILGTPMKFDANGDVEGAQFYIFEVEGGQFKLVTE